MHASLENEEEKKEVLSRFSKKSNWSRTSIASRKPTNHPSYIKSINQEIIYEQDEIRKKITKGKSAIYHDKNSNFEEVKNDV